MDIFYFKLHPLQWKFENDSRQLFRALRLYDGNYLISFLSEKGIIAELLFSQEEVDESLKENHWVITNENGEYL